jgi:hypothetical protein
VTDAPLWLRSLPLLERDAVLYLEGEFDPAVEAFLEFRDSESPTLVAPSSGRSPHTTWLLRPIFWTNSRNW